MESIDFRNFVLPCKILSSRLIIDTIIKRIFNDASFNVSIVTKRITQMTDNKNKISLISYLSY